MFFYDKDMERMMQLKKQEIMREMETAKKRILEELNCVKRSVHTDFCDLLADYNRIDFQMKQLLATAKEEIAKLTAGYSDLISLKFAEYNDMVVDKVEQLEILEREIELFFSNKLAELEAMQTTVQGLIDKVEEIESTAVTQEIFQQTIEQLMQLIQDAHNAMENRFNGRLDELTDDLSENTNDHGAIRKEFADADAAIRQEFANADTAIREEMEVNNAELMEQILAAQVQSDWNEGDEESKAFIKNKPFHYISSNIRQFTYLYLDATEYENAYGPMHDGSGGKIYPSFFENNMIFSVSIHRKTEGGIADQTPEGILFRYPYQKWVSLGIVNEGTEIQLYDYEDDNVKIYVKARTSNAGMNGKWTVSIKNTDAIPTDTVAMLTIETRDYVRPDVWLLGAEAYPNRHLFLNGNSELEWTQYPVVVSPNGTLYFIQVNDDGTLSATPVSNE